MGSPFSYPMHPKEWEYLEKQKAERSRTWKERHANGVPVKLSLDTQEEYNKRMQWYDLDGELDSHLIDNDSPYVLVFGDQAYKKSGSFCNFRYKPEWLEKKGQTNN